MGKYNFLHVSQLHWWYYLKFVSHLSCACISLFRAREISMGMDHRYTCLTIILSHFIQCSAFFSLIIVSFSSSLSQVLRLNVSLIYFDADPKRAEGPARRVSFVRLNPALYGQTRSPLSIARLYTEFSSTSTLVLSSQRAANDLEA